MAATVSSIAMAGMLRLSRVRVRDLISPGWWTTGLRLSSLSLVSGMVILLFLFNKDPRFPMPLLVPVAVITAAGLGEAVRLEPRVRRAGYVMIAASLASGLILFLNVSLIGLPDSPVYVQVGDQHLSFASASYHQARSPADRSECEQRDVVEAIEQVDGRRPRIGILSDSNYWNYFSLPYWAEWEVDRQGIISLFPETRPRALDVLIFGGTWQAKLSPPGYRLAATCTGYDGSKVSLHVSKSVEEQTAVSLLSDGEGSTLGTWSGTHTTVDIVPGKATSSSLAAPDVWAETSFTFSQPIDMSSRSNIRLRWQLSRPDVEAFWVFLEDTGGTKLIWDRTEAAQASPTRVSEALSWPDEVLDGGFRPDSVIRFGFALREPNPAVHPTLVVEEAILAIAPTTNAEREPASFEELYVGAWTGSNTDVARDDRNVVSASTGGPHVWAETSYTLSTPADLGSRSSRSSRTSWRSCWAKDRPRSSGRRPGRR